MMNTDIFDECIHVIDGHTDIWKTMEQVADMESQENPFYVCDVDNIIQKYRAWKSAMPRVEPHYAVKCNDHPVVLKVIAAMGLGFDCASKAEINKILALGVHPSRIIFAHTAKPLSHIHHAAKVHVNLMTFDNELELYKIKKIFPNARTVIRIRYDAKAALCLGLKFGCKPYTEAPRLLQIARDLGIDVVGVSFHVGWGCRDPTAYYGAIKTARDVFEIAANLGYDFNLLDIGGGYPGNADSSIEEYARAINKGLDEFFLDPTVRVISEPGTYFVDSAFNLACNIHSARKVVDENPKNGERIAENVYYINDGVYGSLSLILSSNVIKVPQPLKNYQNAKKYPSVVWGPTCDSTDLIIKDILLPELQLGDWLVFTDMGAYTLTVATTFNSFELPKVFSIISRNNWVLLHNSFPLDEEDFVCIEAEAPVAKFSLKRSEIPGSVCIKG